MTTRAPAVEAAARRFDRDRSGEPPLPLAIGILLLAILAAYGPIIHAGFIWDDDTFLTANPLIKAANGLQSFWFTARAADYWPVTSSTLWLEWRLWSANALGYHVTNLVLHLADTLLLWAVLRRLRLPGAYLAALLFAVHPVNVESVAWITQRKNVLAMLFYLASIWFFLSNEKRPRWSYALSLLAFILAILSKASVVILPLVLLGMQSLRFAGMGNSHEPQTDASHPPSNSISVKKVATGRSNIISQIRNRDRSGLGDLVPYFLIAIAFTAINLWFQGRHPAGAIRTASALERLLGAAAVIWFYLEKALAPLRLMFFYPQWQIQVTDLRWWLPLIAALAVTACLWRYRTSWSRPWLLAWIYFCIALIPVMGFTDIYFMQFSLVADHYQHLAVIAIVALAAYGWSRWRASRPTSAIPLATACLAVAGLAGLSWKQCLIYRDAETLYRATIEVNPRAWLAENNLGLLLDQRTNQALGAAQTAIRAEALAHVQRALAINPACAEAENNWGLIDAETEDLPGAVLHYDRAVQLRPAYAEAHNNLGNVLRRAGKLPEAIGEYQLALRFEPGQAGMHYNLAKALIDAHRTDEAVAELQAALRLDQNDAASNYALGLAQAGQGNLVAAVDRFERALRTRPDYAEAQENLGVALARLGRYDQARVHLEAAARLRPDDASIRANLQLLRAHRP